VKLTEDTHAWFEPEALAILRDTQKFCPKCESEMVSVTATKGVGVRRQFLGLRGNAESLSRFAAALRRVRWMRHSHTWRPGTPPMAVLQRSWCVGIVCSGISQRTFFRRLVPFTDDGTIHASNTRARRPAIAPEKAPQTGLQSRGSGHNMPRSEPDRKAILRESRSGKEVISPQFS
jgi:hypothetical protein